MVESNYNQETSVTVHTVIYIAVLQIIVNLTGVIVIIYHFKVNNISFKSSRILSVIPLILNILISTNQIISSNVLISPALFDIESYCDITARITVILVASFRYSIWIFFLTRIKYYFNSTPFKISNIMYYIHLFIYSLIAGADSLSFNAKPTVFFASNNQNLKFCQFTIDDSSPIIYGICGNCIDILLLYLLYSKTKKLETYQLENCVNLSVHFSSRNNLINSQIMKKAVISGVIFLFSGWIIMIIFAIYNVQCLFGLINITSCIAVLTSFDIKSEDFCGGNNNDHDNNNNNDHIISIQERDNYLRDLMKRYYEVPQRNISRLSLQIEGH